MTQEEGNLKSRIIYQFIHTHTMYIHIQREFLGSKNIEFG